jgi:hypothetical protein
MLEYCRQCYDALDKRNVGSEVITTYESFMSLLEKAVRQGNSIVGYAD